MWPPWPSWPTYSPTCRRASMLPCSDPPTDERLVQYDGEKQRRIAVPQGRGGRQRCPASEATMTTKTATAIESAAGQGLRSLRLGLGQIAPKLGDVQANLELHLETLERARTQKTEMLLFPELSLAGYQLRDLVPDVAQDRRSPELQQLVRESRGLCLGFGFVEEAADHRFFNSYAFCQDGRLVHVHRKAYLPTYGLFEEGRLYAAGEHLRAFDTRLGRLGVVLCEDLWHPSVLYVLSQDGARLIVAAAASP